MNSDFVGQNHAGCRYPIPHCCHAVKGMNKYTVYQDTGQWLPVFNWFWSRPNESGLGHGPYPTRWLAKLSAWAHTR